MSLTNLCPHAIRYTAVIEGQPMIVTLPSSPEPARVETQSHETGLIDGVPVQMQTYGDITGLPPYDHMSPKRYVVSGIVLAALKLAGSTRPDVMAPATGPRDNAMRGADGQIIAVTKMNVLSMRDAA